MSKLGNVNQYLINHAIRCTFKAYFLPPGLGCTVKNGSTVTKRKVSLWVGTVNMNIKGLVGYKGELRNFDIKGG